MPSTPPDNRSPVRICHHCQNAYPVTQFRLRNRSGAVRMNQCRLCHNQAEQLRRQRKRGLLTKRQFHQYLTSLKNQRTSMGIERVYLDLVQQCGGTEGLLKAWTQTLEKDLAAGGFKAYRHIASILRLMEYCEDAQPDKPDYSTMSDEELMDRLARATILDE
jgi:hypothetical protein